MSVSVQERGILIRLDLDGWHHLGVRLTADGNLLHVHRSPLDGSHAEVILECPPGFDPYAATAEAQAGSFRINLPLQREVDENRAIEYFGEISERSFQSTPFDDVMMKAPLEMFSRN